VPHFSMVPPKGENKTEPGSPIQSSRQATTELTLKTRNMTELLTPDMRNGYIPLPALVVPMINRLVRAGTPTKRCQAGATSRTEAAPDSGNEQKDQPRDEG
jgi:hypothetical protein